LIKRFLDLGVQTLLIPYVQNAEEARRAVAAIRYPPEGVRGVSAISRATGFGRVDRYARRVAEELCLLVQVETGEALKEIEAIAAVEGIDGIFIGPGDLAASLGHIGEPSHSVVVTAIEDAIRRTRACGKAAGILTLDIEFARRCIELGTTFTAVAMDVAVLARGTEKIAEQFRNI
jgi:4-hydroxy-2-oxoheptanedioate aldolase